MRTLRKRWSMVCVVLVSLFFTTGCWDEADIGDIAPVLAIGIDLSEDEETAVYLEFPFVNQEKTKQENKSMLISGTGSSLQEALEDAERRSSRQLFYPHNMLVMFSNRYAESTGIKQALGFIERSPFFRENEQIAIVDGSPEDLMQNKNTMEYVNAYQLRQLVAGMGQTSSSSQIDVMNHLMGPAETSTIAWLTQRNSMPSVDGIGVISRGKLVLHLSKQDADDLLWLIQHRREQWVRFKSLHKNRTAFVVISQPMTTFDRRNGQIKIAIRGFAQVAQLQQGDKVDVALSEALNQELNQEITGRATQIIRKLQMEGLDILDIAKAVQAVDPHQWNAWQSDWPRVFSRMKIAVDSQINIVRNGVTKNEEFSYGDKQKQGLME